MRRALSLLLLVLVVGAGVSPPKKGKPAKPSDPLAPIIDRTVRQYVRDQVEEEGSFTLEDDVLGRAWDAKLMSVRAHELRRHSGGPVSVCVDFNGEDGTRKQPLDVDFVLSQGDDEWLVDEVLIHRVGGTSRFTYGPKNERVPVKARKGAGRPSRPGSRASKAAQSGRMNSWRSPKTTSRS